MDRMILEFAFRHVDEICNALKRKPKVQDPKAPFDGFDEWRYRGKSKNGNLKMLNE